MKLDEIARLAGVSRTTASYVINGKAKQYRVSDKTIEKVLAVVKQYNYQPNAVAAGLRAGKTRSIGLIIPDFANSSYTKIAHFLERQARLNGYQLLIACSEDLPTIEMQCAKHLMQRKVDALIVATCLPHDHPFYQSQECDDIPIIAFDRFLDPEHFFSIVGNDEQDANVLATEMFSRVQDTIVYLGSTAHIETNALRQSGFCRAIEHHQDVVDFLYTNKYEREEAEHAFSAKLVKDGLPKALFTTSFSLLQGAIDAILKIYSVLPDDILLVSFGDHEFLDFLNCPILSMAQRHQLIADQLFDTVLKVLKDKHALMPEIIKIERTLCYRGSLRRTL